MTIPPIPELPCASNLMPPESMQMIENDTAKLEKRLNRRSSSCAYPMLWRTFTSSFLSTSVYPDADTSAMSHPYVAGLNRLPQDSYHSTAFGQQPCSCGRDKTGQPYPGGLSDRQEIAFFD